VAIDQNTLAVGTPGDPNDGPACDGSQIGCVEIYVFDGEIFMPQQQIIPDPGDQAGVDYFGAMIDLKGDTILVAGYNLDEQGVYEKTHIFVFQRSADAWSQKQKITIDNNVGEDLVKEIRLGGDSVFISLGVEEVIEVYK
jgi:hypothetical protein